MGVISYRWKYPRDLKISAKCQDIFLFKSLIILIGMMFSLFNLQLLSEGNHFDISSLFIGAIINDSKLLGRSKYSIELLENL